MDEKHEILKYKVEKAYQKIKDAQELLEEIRKECEHPETKLSTYSTGPGRYYDNTKVCSVCGDVIAWEDIPFWTETGSIEWLANRNHG